MSKVTVFNQTTENIDEHEKTLKEVFNHVEEKESFSVIFITNEEIKLLNKTYRQIDEETDVLSFISDEEDYLGDIFISLEKAKQQAIDYNHSLKREISFLAVHGYLHLKGHDHKTKEEEKIMNDLTEEILNKANVRRDKNDWFN